MSLSDHFFKGKFCKYSIRYFFAWCFFLSSICVTTTIILINPKHIDYSNLQKSVKIIFVGTLVSIIGIISRCMCYKPEVYSELSYDNNILQYSRNPYQVNYKYTTPIDY